MNKIKSWAKREGSAYLFLAPYLILFVLFIIIPVVAAIGLSFTNFDSVNLPKFIGLKNYIALLTSDAVFMQYVVPNTLKFSLIAGPLGYALSFIMAWMLAQIQHKPRTLLALILDSPSMTSGVAMGVIWKVLFNGDQSGYLNSLLMQLGLITEPIQWLQSTEYLMPVMIIVTLWSSMGVGFLSILAGILNINQEVYEAGYIDGIKNRFQEIIHITIPSIIPTIVTLFILRTGSLLSVGFEKAYLMQTTANLSTSDVISTYVYRQGLAGSRFSYATAVGMFNSVINLAFLLISNYGSRKLTENSLW